MRYDRWQADSWDYPYEELHQELKMLLQEIKNKDDKRVTFLMDGELIVGCWSPYFHRNFFKRDGSGISWVRSKYQF